jgi:hypothetical protein
VGEGTGYVIYINILADVKWNGNAILFVYKIALTFTDRSNLVRNEMPLILCQKKEAQF